MQAKWQENIIVDHGNWLLTLQHLCDLLWQGIGENKYIGFDDC